MRAALALALAVALTACAVAVAALRPPPGSHCGPGPNGAPNAMPILTGNPVFVRSIPNAALYTVGSGDDTLPVVHLWGTPYEKGFAHGTLMKEQMAGFLTATWAYLEAQVDQGINGTLSPFFPQSVIEWLADVGLAEGLDITSDLTAPYTGAYFFEEMHGMADATGFDYDTIRRIHMIGELTRGDCSMFGAWGNALADPNGLITMRALDWNMDGPFHNFPQLTVYHAAPNSTEVSAFVNIGWTGWVGSITGVNSDQISIHEIGVAFPDDTFGKESSSGVPFTHVLRDILQFDSTQLDGVSRLASAHRTCDLILGVGGGKERVFNSIQYSASVCGIMNDLNMRPVAPWHEPIPNVIYYGMDWICPGYNQLMHDQLSKFHGNITTETAVRNVMSLVQTGDLHVHVTDLVNMQMFVAHAAKDGAQGPVNAYQRSFIQIDLKALFATAPPARSEKVVEALPSW